MMRQSPLSRRVERAGAAAAVRLDEAAVCGARSEPAPQTKAGDADDEDGGEPIDERQAAIMRHAADVDDDWSDDDGGEEGRRPTDPTQREIAERAAMLHSAESRDAIGAWRRIASKKMIEKRFHGKPEAWSPPEMSDTVFHQRGRPFADE